LSGGARAEYEHLEKSVLNFHAADFTELIEQAGLSLVKVDFMNFGSVGLYVAAAPSEVDECSNNESSEGNENSQHAPSAASPSSSADTAEQSEMPAGGSQASPSDSPEL